MKATPEIRYERREWVQDFTTEVRRTPYTVLQQKWVDDQGNEEWRDVPTVGAV